jgi:hypothetical protein
MALILAVVIQVTVTRKYVSNGIQRRSIVPVLLGLLLMVVVFSFERYAVISKAASGNLINS